MDPVLLSRIQFGLVAGFDYEKSRSCASAYESASYAIASLAYSKDNYSLSSGVR